MKKKEQEYMNLCAIGWLDLFRNAGGRPEYREQLYKCSAGIYENDDFIVLRSYETDVAIYDKRSGCFCDVLRYVYGYTATSAQHIAKFKRWLMEHDATIYFDLRYYPV